ncbi:hypothetical protein Y032_0093g2611 [Ancylostoma ceylanicum]|uniref:Suppressor APC domain-containing protein n=1 Tax=Ancylostoma ceylanicum TaxID=53326 RepID=A0A016TLP7_9BILA|nr:hypothetical protein Y032_0093g2611 [Ancylostoma ceylanicum]
MQFSVQSRQSPLYQQHNNGPICFSAGFTRCEQRVKTSCSEPQRPYRPVLNMRSENPSPDLHPEFVESLRVLFDILDTSRTGRIRYENLCARFSELHHPQLPPTFLSCVGKVTPANGLISFERFLTAVKLSLRDAFEINNNSLYRVQSEGRLSQGFDKRRMQAPAMGVNGLDRRTVIYGSQPSLNEPRYNQTQGFERTPAPPYMPLPPSNPLYVPACNYANVYDAAEPHVAMRPKKANTVRSQKEESRMRHAVPPANAVPRVPVNRSRPQSTASYNSLASSGLENIAWRNSSLSTSTSDSQRRHTLCEDDTAPRVASYDALRSEYVRERLDSS